VEAFALGVALRVAARFGNHHSQVATVFKGTEHARFQQCGLQSSAAQFGHGRRATEERNALMQIQYSGRARLAIDFCEETRAPFSGDAQGAVRFHEGLKLRMFVRPTARTDIAP
jgi:hypothetical protein